jgi:hypothetical protein
MENRTETTSHHLWTVPCAHDNYKVEVHLNPKEFVLVYGAQPHHPIGSRAAHEIRITSPDGKQTFVLPEEHALGLISILETAQQFTEENEKNIPVDYRHDLCLE